ncbi:ABC transporter ATP-binding protein [Planctomycetota bacterium]
MSDVVIRVDKLSKRYRIGQIQPYRTLREAVMEGATAPLRWLGLRRNASNDAKNGDNHEQIWALRDVSFEVQRSEVLGIIGRNGAGKSTLLKILSRVTEPTSGSAEIRGRVGSLLEVGTGFHPELTGRENVYLNGAILGMKRCEIDERFEEIVDFSGVERFLDTPVKRYSSGMRVRLGFAVAAHLEPDVLIVDEVLAVGDVAFQKKCAGKMGKVAGEGRTILLVSHNLATIRRLCGRCLLVDKGELKKLGETEEVVQEYVAGLDSRADGPAESTFAVDLSKDFQLLKARSVDGSGEPKEAFECDERVIVELTCRVNKPVPGLYGYFCVRREPERDTVMVSDSFDTSPNPLDNLAVGQYTLRVTIPARTLAPGAYNVYLNFTSSQSAQGFNVDSPGTVARFRLDDFRSRRGNKRLGYFSTVLSWEVSPAP